ncbi:MAG: helix-turn-helix domain-containing protein [Candidatus Microsaccharimonas sp.]
MAPTVYSKITPIEAMEFLRMSLKDLVAKTGLSLDATTRAVRGSSKSINQGTAHKIADALGLNVLDIDWPSTLTKVGRPPLTGGSYTRGTRATKQKAPGGMGQPIVSEEPVATARRRALPEVFCTDPEHNLLLAVSGVCDLCVT